MTLPKDSLRPVGFAEDEGILDYDARSFIGYRLLHEYFIFPEKFLFFDIVNLERAAGVGAGEEIELCVFLSEFERADRLQRLAQTTDKNTFRLGCAPAVNLFKQPAEPIRLTHERSEYHIVPDVRRQGAMEVYSVDSVRRLAQSDDGDRLMDIQPFYSLKHTVDEDQGKAFWYAARRPSPRKDDAGTELYLCLVDLGFNPAVCGRRDAEPFAHLQQSRSARAAALRRTGQRLRGGRRGRRGLAHPLLAQAHAHLFGPLRAEAHSGG